MNSIYKLRKRLHITVSNVKKSGNFIDIKREQIILNRLEAMLGKPKEDVKKLLSDDLLSLLTLVPFTKD